MSETAIPSHSSDAARSRSPLAGLKVLELGQLIAGPFAGKTLGDFGAEVIKVEPPGTGDPSWLVENGLLEMFDSHGVLHSETTA